MENPVQGTIGDIKYRCAMEWRNGKFIADEPVSSGGQDTGPDPYTLLLSSLISCTLVTMRMYANRKGWDIPGIKVEANLAQVRRGEQLTTFIDRNISFDDPVDPEQQQRLFEIASACPISKMLEAEIKVRSFMNEDGLQLPVDY